MTWEHFSEFEIMMPYILKNQKAPHLMNHAVPPSYGKEKSVEIRLYVDKIKAGSKSKIETVFLNGTHHFHMIKPKETCEIILEFLNRLKRDQKTLSKL